jgi:hypothetical protein
MIAEFADYQSWIAWVPIVGLLVFPLLFRQILPLTLAMLGSFVGFVATSLVPPLGRNAEQLGANLAVGIVGGAVVGALVGVLIRTVRPPTRARDASVTVVGWAIGLGVLGAIVGGFFPSFFGDPLDLTVEVLRTIAVGGGLGWSVGALVGWRQARAAPTPANLQRWLLSVAAAAIAILGAWIVASIQACAFGPSIDYHSRPDRLQLPLIAGLCCIDTAIAVGTLVAVAVKGRGSARNSELPAGVAVPST